MKPQAKLLESHWVPDGTITLVCESVGGKEFKARGVRPQTLQRADHLESHGHVIEPGLIWAAKVQRYFFYGCADNEQFRSNDISQ